MPNEMTALASAWLASAASCWAPNIGGSGAATAPRCQQASSATAASMPLRPRRSTTSPAPMECAASLPESATAARSSPA